MRQSANQSIGPRMNPSTVATTEAVSSSAVKTEVKNESIPKLGILEEDDEFEEFPVEGTHLIKGQKINVYRLG